MIIAFEGLDKLGKSTQAYMLFDYMVNKKKMKVKFFKQPDNYGDALGSALRNIVSKKGMDLVPVAEWALHLASHAQQWQKQIIPAVKEGYHIILDRCWLSAVAYQGYGKGVRLSTIQSAERDARKNHVIDHIFVFHSCFRNPLEKGLDKNNSMEKQLAESEDFRERVSDAYWKLAKDMELVLVDAEKYFNKKLELHEFIKGILVEELETK